MLEKILANNKLLITLIYGYLFIVSYILCRISVFFVKKLSLKFHLHDEPGELKIPKFPKYLSGGIAIVFTIIMVILGHMGMFIIFIKSGFQSHLPGWVMENYKFSIKAIPQLTAILIGSGLAALIGFLDDLKRLWIGTKLVFQFIISFLVVYSGIVITFVNIPYVNETITILWLVGITNAINLLDNMDGLAPGVSAMISGCIFIISVSMRQYFVGLIAIVIVGTLVGFLRKNFVPTRISIGKTGAYFIGYLLASVSIVTTYYTKDMPTYYAVLTPFFLMITPVFDTVSVFVIRLFHGKSVLEGDQNHLSHRLCLHGLSKLKSVVAILLLTLISSISAILLICVNDFGAYIILFQMFFIVSFFAVLMIPHKL